MVNLYTFFSVWLRDGPPPQKKRDSRKIGRWVRNKQTNKKYVKITPTITVERGICLLDMYVDAAEMPPSFFFQKGWGGKGTRREKKQKQTNKQTTTTIKGGQ